MRLILAVVILFLGNIHDFRADAVGGRTDIVDHTPAAAQPVTVAQTPGQSWQPAAATDGATLLVAWREERPDEVYLLWAATSTDGVTWQADPIPDTIDGWQPQVVALGPGRFRLTYWQAGGYRSLEWRAGHWLPPTGRLYLPLTRRP